ncbi:MAG: YHS domain-containing protein [Fimbriimonadaceae bacterium]
MKWMAYVACALAPLILVTGCSEKSEEAPSGEANKTTTSAAQGKVVDGDYVNADGELLCPVMNVTVASKEDTFGVTEVDGVTYYFCCAACKPMFDREPDKYALKN